MVLQLVKKFPAFLEPESTLPYSQVLSTLGTRTASINACCQDDGLRGCFASFRTCQPAKQKRCETPVFRSLLIEGYWTTDEVCIYVRTVI